MNMVEAKEKLYDLAEMFFKGATIIWSEQINTKPPLPYITLKCGAVNRAAFPIVDGEGRRFYQAKTTLEVQLFTKGQVIKAEKGTTSNYINTASSDLTEFANFIDSDTVTDIIAGLGMNVLLMPPVRDLTELMNDSKYRYRAMAEFEVGFAMEADGPYGLGGVPLMPNSSGGGTIDMAEAQADAIEEVEILETIEGGNDDEE